MKSRAHFRRLEEPGQGDAMRPNKSITPMPDLLVASQFQGFCRELHAECVKVLVEHLKPHRLLRPLVESGFTRCLQLDSRNAQPGSIGADFGLLGIIFWDRDLINMIRRTSTDGKRRKN